MLIWIVISLAVGAIAAASNEAYRSGYAHGKREGAIECVDRMLEAPPGLYGGTGIAGEDIRCGDRTEINPDTGHLQRSRVRMVVPPTEAQVGVCIVCGGDMGERTHDTDCPYHPVYDDLFKPAQSDGLKS
jgi:hypothetical protein